MKKYIVWLLVLSLMVGAVGCGKQDTHRNSTDHAVSADSSIDSTESKESFEETEYSSTASSEEISEEKGSSEDASFEDSSAEESSTDDSSESELPTESSTETEEPVIPEDTRTESDETSEEESSSEETSEPDNSSYEDITQWTNTMIGQQSTDYHGFSAEELDAYFNDAMVTGDSVTNGLKIYTQNYEDIFNGIIFHTGASYGFNNALSPVTDNSQHPLYRGQRYTIWGMAQLTGVKKIFIGFGLNDFGYSTKQRIITCLDTITSKVHAVNPEIEIIILSSGYFTRNGEVNRPHINDHRTNKRQREYNQLVLDYCNQNGLDYIDVSNCFSDDYGYLRSDITLDNYCHPKIQEYTVWRDILYSYAAQKMLGIYTNPETMS